MRVQLREGVIIQAVDDEAVLLDTVSETYFALNPTGHEALDLLLSGVAWEAMVAELADAYEAPEAEIEADVRALVSELTALGLVVSEPAG